MEECLNLDELQLILEASREKELRSMKFFASLKGIDLDKEGVESAADRVKEIKKRVAARKSGMTDKQAKFNEFGLDIEED